MELSITRHVEAERTRVERAAKPDEPIEDYCVRLCMAVGMSAQEASEFVLEVMFG
jgi:hypothetical protein